MSGSVLASLQLLEVGQEQEVVLTVETAEHLDSERKELLKLLRRAVFAKKL